MKKIKNREIFLRSTKNIDWKLIETQELFAKLFDKKNDISDRDKAIILFNFVRDEIDYKIPDHLLSGDFITASKLLRRGKGNCLQKSLILSALGRAAGIPTRLHFVDIINHIAPPNFVKMWGKKLNWHCYMEFFIENEWIAANPDYPTTLCAAKGYPVVQFDGIHNAMLPALDLNDHMFIEYTQDHGWFADLPRLQMHWNYGKAYIVPFVKIWFKKRKKRKNEKGS